MTQNASDGTRVELRGQHFSLSNVARLKESGIVLTPADVVRNRGVDH